MCTLFLLTIIHQRRAFNITNNMKTSTLFALIPTFAMMIPSILATKVPCNVDSDCNDNNPCTVDTCTENAVCSYDYDCKLCDLSKLVNVDLVAGINRDKTSWEILNYETNERVMAKDVNFDSDSNIVYSKNQCLNDGAYLFVIDAKDEDIKYEVSIGSNRIIKGIVKSTRTHFFLIDDNSPRLRLRGSKNSI